MSDYKRFRVSREGDVTIVDLVDHELSDLLMQDEFDANILGLVAQEKPSKLLVNFQVVNYCNTGIINSLISAKHRLADHGGKMKLCELSQHVHDALKALNLIGTVFAVYATKDEALAAFAE